MFAGRDRAAAMGCAQARLLACAVAELPHVVPHRAGVQLCLLPCRLLRRLARAGESPDLAADLEGITHVKLFACGDAVRRGRTAEQIVELAAAQGLSISVLMPSGEALSLVGGAAPAVQL